ncbi:hypothetical protein LEP1GSC132_2341 [Leptospira kirschneri str. 200803703]|nr:hypothetical protein LEP1GSC132_2341 [Leptospira kirschneri str. 200803703]
MHVSIHFLLKQRKKPVRFSADKVVTSPEKFQSTSFLNKGRNQN